MPVSAIKSINHAVCLSLVGTYNGSYFGVEKNSFCLCLSSMSVLEKSNLVVPFVKVELTRSSSASKNPCLLLS